LDTVAKVRALSPEEAARGLPVRLEATVIYFDPHCLSLFVRDDTACTYVRPSSPTGGLYASIPMKPGSRVRIEGVTDPGEFFPVIKQQRIELLGDAPLPEPRRISESELFSPSLDSQWVEVPALVTGVENDNESKSLVVEVYGQKLKAELPFNEYSAERSAVLMQRPVRLQGIAATVFNTERQMTGRNFYIPSYDQIIPTDSITTGSNAPLRAVNRLLRNDDNEQTLVRVEGIVTQTDRNNIYLRDATGSLQVCTAGKDLPVAGDRVEAEGFAALAPYRPIFRARKVVVTGHTEIPIPKTLDFEEKLLPRFQAELIGQDAEFLARQDGSADVVLHCRMGDRFFDAVLPQGGTLPKGLSPGDLVRLTGICELTTTHPFPRIEWVNGFRLHLPESGGVIILRHAPWWTLKHLAALLGLAIALTLLSLAWVWILRNRVKAQTKIIGSQIQREAVHGERQRIARELHDTVEQELSGLSIQLGSIADEIEEAPAEVPTRFHTAIQNAQKVLRHCREEARSSIRDLRSIQLEQRGLAGALQELLPVTAAKGGAEFQMQVTGEPRPLPGISEAHLLRIAQEGVGNAAKHAGARTITAVLDYAPDAVTLAIRDDGRGFDPAAPPPDGHFGLLGMQERANKIQAGFGIESAPGKGTMIRVVVPLLNNQKD
jgi:signal transduction histidine kinase